MICWEYVLHFPFFARLRTVKVWFDKHRTIVSWGHMHSTLLHVFHWHIELRVHKYRFLKRFLATILLNILCLYLLIIIIYILPLTTLHHKYIEWNILVRWCNLFRHNILRKQTKMIFKLPEILMIVFYVF